MTPAGGSVSWPTAETIAGLEARKLEYLLGARERSDALLKTIVLANDDPFVPLLIERRSARKSSPPSMRN